MNGRQECNVELPPGTSLDRCLKDTNLSWKAKGIYALLYNFAANKDYITCGMLKTISLDGTSALYSGLKELEKNYYLKRERLREGGQFSNITYKLS